MKQNKYPTLRHWLAWTRWSVVVAVATCAAACTGDDGFPKDSIAAQQPGMALSTRSIRIEAGTDAAAEGNAPTEADSRTVATTAQMPEGYTLYTSAYYTSTEAPGADGNYFSGIPFTLTEGVWEASTPYFWPLNGLLQFLTIATDATAIPLDGRMVWAARRYTDGVRVQVPEHDGGSELLYAITQPIDCNADIVPMTFRHAEALLEFNLRLTTGNGLTALTGIDVNDVAMGGTLNVATYPFLDVTWNIDTAAFRPRSVPGSGSASAPVTLSTTATAFTMAIVPQEQTSFTFHLLERPSTDTPWTEATPREFTHRCTDRKWTAGRKYTYAVAVTPVAAP